MGQAEPHRPGTSETPPPLWWTVDHVEVPLEWLETGPLPDGTRPGDIKWYEDLVRAQAREIRLLRERLEEELKHRYGSRSEKHGKGNGAGDQPDPTTGSSTNTAGPENPEEAPAKKPKKPGHGRRPIPPDLPRDEVEVPLDDESCKRCHGPTHRLERVESFRFDYVPGYIRVRVLVRWRCACDDPTCDGPFRIAKLPPEPIPKGRATAGFLAHLLVIKFADHCPIYRFRKILLRQQVDLPLSTLVAYCKKSTELLKPLWEVMRQQVLKSEIIKTDDTHVRVRLPGKKGVIKGHLWAYKGDGAHPYVVFEFKPHWKGEAPQTFLATFEGYIQADAYKGYDELFKNPKRIEVGCMAHSRRKWVKAKASSPHVAGQALEMIGQLYAIEDDCKDLTVDQRKCARQERSAPVLEKLRAWMEDQKTRALPKSAVGEAIEYARNQWVALTRFLEDGRLKIDNNEVERELRGVALGRKNWMAIGSEVGGETAAIGYTMIASAVASGVEPVEWLTDVLKRIVTCPPDQLIELLPDRWKAARSVRSPASPSGSPVDESAGDVTDAPTNTPASSQPPTAPTGTEAAQLATESPTVIGDDGRQDEPVEPVGPGADRLSGVNTMPASPEPSSGPPSSCRESSDDPVSISTTPVEQSTAPSPATHASGPVQPRPPRPEPRPRPPRQPQDEVRKTSRPARAPP